MVIFPFPLRNLTFRAYFGVLTTQRSSIIAMIHDTSKNRNLIIYVNTTNENRSRISVILSKYNIQLANAIQRLVMTRTKLPFASTRRETNFHT